MTVQRRQQPPVIREIASPAADDKPMAEEGDNRNAAAPVYEVKRLPIRHLFDPN